jgi:hypothetical protein
VSCLLSSSVVVKHSSHTKVIDHKYKILAPERNYFYFTRQTRQEACGRQKKENPVRLKREEKHEIYLKSLRCTLVSYETDTIQMEGGMEGDFRGSGSRRRCLGSALCVREPVRDRGVGSVVDEQYRGTWREEEVIGGHHLT